MKAILTTFVAMAACLTAQNRPAATPEEIPASAGDDVRGYNDTPQIPGQKWKVHDMDRPRPVKVTPGALVKEAPPSDAIVLFDGKDLSQWTQLDQNGKNQEPRWKIVNGDLEITPGSGGLVTKASFGDCQLHVEWMIPKGTTGAGQWRGNSGVELMTRYEIQVLDSYDSPTYADGGAGAIYGVWPPLVNPARPQGEWNVYDIAFEAPRFDGDKVVKPAYATLFFNGVLAQNHRAFLGTTVWRQVATYTPHPAEQPFRLQDHDRVVRFRNIWIRRIASPNGQ